MRLKIHALKIHGAGLKITGGAEDVLPSSSCSVRPFLGRPCSVFRLQSKGEKTTRTTENTLANIESSIYPDMKTKRQKQGKKQHFATVHKYGKIWYIYKVCKKNQKKVKKNLEIWIFCRTFVADKENNRKTNN